MLSWKKVLWGCISQCEKYTLSKLNSRIRLVSSLAGWRCISHSSVLRQLWPYMKFSVIAASISHHQAIRAWSYISQKLTIMPRIPALRVIARLLYPDIYYQVWASLSTSTEAIIPRLYIIVADAIVLCKVLHWWVWQSVCSVIFTAKKCFKNSSWLFTVALNISPPYEIHTLQCMGKSFNVEFQRIPLKCIQNVLTI